MGAFADIANAGLDDIEDLATLAADFPGHHILLYGPKGTGKTTLAHLIARLMAEARQKKLAPNTPVLHSLQCHSELTDGPLTYSFLPNEAGGAFMVDGAAKLTWSDGTVLVLDEIAHIDGAPAMSTLFKVMDDKKIARIKMPDNTYITPSEGFTVIATMNDTPDVLPGPIQDRFSIKLCMWRPSRSAIESLKTPALRKLMWTVYKEDPDNAFPSFRDVAHFEDMCRIKEVSPTDSNDTIRNRNAQLCWEARWRDAVSAIDEAARQLNEEANNDNDEEDESNE